MSDEKFFDNWIIVKKKLHNYGEMHVVHEGEIWWCAIGENVGVEINGKHERFSRPVLVYKKLSQHGFMGIPLTSKPHVGGWYVEFSLGGRREFAVLAQAKVVSVFRLYRKMGVVSNTDFTKIKEGFHELYCEKICP